MDGVDKCWRRSRGARGEEVGQGEAGCEAMKGVHEQGACKGA